MQMKFKYKILHELKFNKIFKETRLERVTQHVWKELHNTFGKSLHNTFTLQWGV